MGSPQPPTKEQLAILEKAGQLQEMSPSRNVGVVKGDVAVTFPLPRQGVSLVKLTW